MTAFRLALVFVLTFGVDFWSLPTLRAAELLDESGASEEAVQSQRVRRSVRLARQGSARPAALPVRAASDRTLRDGTSDVPRRAVGGVQTRKAPPPVRESSSAPEDH